MRERVREKDGEGETGRRKFRISVPTDFATGASSVVRSYIPLYVSSITTKGYISAL